MESKPETAREAHLPVDTDTPERVGLSRALDSRSAQWARVAGLALVAALLLAANIWMLRPEILCPNVKDPSGRLFLSDDALISARYAQRFMEGKGLTWNDGERVEGYTNLLWVLVTAGLGALGLDLILAVRLLGIVGILAAIAALAWRHRGEGAGQSVGGLVAAGGFALAIPTGVWAIGGLEQPMLAGLLAWAMVLCGPMLAEELPAPRKLVAPGMLLGLICLTRADGALFTVLICAGLVLGGRFRRPGWRTALLLAVIPLAFFLGQLAFRLVYYGDWVPNSAYAKVAFTPVRLRLGWEYVGRGLRVLWGLSLPALAAVVLASLGKADRRWVRLLVVLLGGWLGYVMLIGGDIFPVWRHLVAAIPLLAMLAGLAAQWTLEATLHRAKSTTVTVAAAWLALVGVWATLHRNNDQTRLVAEERWEWDGQVIGEFLKEAFGDRQALLAVDPAGCVPYFSGLPCIDMLGLNDYFLAHHPPPDFGKGKLGHELGNGQYVLGRKPDLALFTLPNGRFAHFRSAREMAQDPAFRASYRPVVFQVETPWRFRSLIWVRLDGKCGIRHASKGALSVPAYLLEGHSSNVTRLEGAGRLGTQISRDHPAAGRKLPIPAGAWQIAVKASGPVHLWAGVTGSVLTPCEAPAVIEVPRAASGLDLKIEPVDPQTDLHEVVLTRAQGAAAAIGIPAGCAALCREGTIDAEKMRKGTLITAVAIVREEATPGGEPTYRAVSHTGKAPSVGRTPGEALDALTTQ